MLAVLAAAGPALHPVEDRLRGQLREAHLLLPPPEVGAFEQMSQSALMGTLGGLRSLVAFYLTLAAYDDFDSKEWDDLRKTYQIITSLEPREESHWTSAIWHLGINATASMQYDDRLPPFESERRFNEYCFQAIDFAERGIAQLPDSAAIRLQLAEVYREKLKDDCAVSRIYGDIIGLPGAPPYARRFHGYFMARCPGHEREAYDYLIALYREGEQQRLPTLIKEIKTLEEKLSVPAAQRIPDADPDQREQAQPRRPGKKRPGGALPGGIVVP